MAKHSLLVCRAVARRLRAARKSSEFRRRGSRAFTTERGPEDWTTVIERLAASGVNVASPTVNGSLDVGQRAEAGLSVVSSHVGRHERASPVRDYAHHDLLDPGRESQLQRDPRGEASSESLHHAQVGLPGISLSGRQQPHCRSRRSNWSCGRRHEGQVLSPRCQRRALQREAEVSI